MALVMSRVTFRGENIHLDKSLDAASDAYALVTREGIPFREAYRRIADTYSD